MAGGGDDWADDFVDEKDSNEEEKDSKEGSKDGDGCKDGSKAGSRKGSGIQITDPNDPGFGLPTHDPETGRKYSSVEAILKA